MSRRPLPAWTWLLVLALVAAAAYWLGSQRAGSPVPSPSAGTPASAPASVPEAARGSHRSERSARGRRDAAADRSSPTTTGSASIGHLPPEARETLRLIQQGGPFPHRQDGVVFQNREGRLPSMPRGYYHEYTVETLGLSHRGARRIVTGGTPPDVWYYSDDHYRSFARFDPGSQ